MALLTNINGKFSVSDAGAVTFNNAFTFPTTDGTANYVLKTNGSGTVSWSPDSSPTVYWDDNGSANDIYNTNAGNVGIGTDLPGLHKLNVHMDESYGSYGPSSGFNVTNENTSLDAGFITVSARYNNPSPAQLYYRAGGIGGGKETAAGNSEWGGYLSFWTTSDGTAGAASGMFEHMRINADGNVGIGTTDPASKLEVSGRISGGQLGNPKITRQGLGLYVDFNDKACISGVNATEKPIDLGPNNYDLTLLGGANFEYLNGIGTFYFDGLDDRIQVNSFNVPDTTNSYEIWHWANAQTTYETWWDSGTERPLLGTYNNYLIAYPAYSGSTLGTTIDTGKWYHVVWAFNGNNDLDIFVNGVRVHEALGGTIAQRTGTFNAWLGGDTSSETTNGYIAIARTYTRQLTPADVLQNYNADVESFAGVTPSLGIVQAGGNVGIGTSSPDIGSNSGTAILTLKNTGTNRAVLNMTSTTPGTGPYAQEAFYNGGVLKTLVQHVGDGSTDSGYIKWFTTASGGATTERMRITSAGGISFGSTGTAYGTSGQVLTSNGNASPSWQAAGGGTVTWPNVGAGVRTNYTLGIKPPANGYAGFYFTTSTGTGEDAGYFLIRGTSDAGQVYKAEGITLVADAGWLSLVSRTTSTTGVRILSGSSSAERLVIKDDGLSYFVGNLGIGNSSTGFSSEYDNLVVGSGSGDNGIIIYSGTTNASTLAFAAENVPGADFKIRVEHDYPNGQMEVHFEHEFNSYLRMFERTSGQDPMIKVGMNSIPSGSNSGDDAIMQFRPDNNNWHPAIAINAEDSGGNARGFIEMKSNRSQTFYADYFLKFFNYNSNEIGSIRVNNNNNNVAYNTSSDYRLKEDLKEFKALDTVCKIKVYNYTWKDDPSDFRDQGILAHELDELIPQAVSGEKDALDKDNNILPQSVDYSKIVPHLVQSIQELKAEIEILKNK